MGLFYTVVLRFLKVCYGLPVAIGSKNVSCLHCLAHLPVQSVREEAALFYFFLVLYLQPIVQRPHFEDAR